MNYNPLYFRFRKVGENSDIYFYEAVVRGKTTEISWYSKDQIYCTTYLKTEIVKDNLKNEIWKPCEYYKSIYRYLNIK